MRDVLTKKESQSSKFFFPNALGVRSLTLGAFLALRRATYIDKYLGFLCLILDNFMLNSIIIYLPNVLFGSNF